MGLIVGWGERERTRASCAKGLLGMGVGVLGFRTAASDEGGGDSVRYM
jgi:hypothetical protein